MVGNSPQRVCEDCLTKMDKSLKLFDGRKKKSFDKALEVMISFCENKIPEFEKWKKKIENQQQKNQS
jgi:hypothetical protein